MCLLAVALVCRNCPTLQAELLALLPLQHTPGQDATFSQLFMQQQQQRGNTAAFGADASMLYAGGEQVGFCFAGLLPHAKWHAASLSMTLNLCK